MRLGTALAVIAVVFVVFQALRSSPPAPAPARPTAEPAGAVAGAKPRSEPARASEPDSPLPRGLRGTEPSGGLSTDAFGHFVPGRDAVLFFEYYLSASNEETIPAIAARIRREIGKRLARPADAEARAFLETYLDYREAGDAEFRAPGLAESADLERRLQWTRELRREHFGPELAKRLFGEEEEAARIHLERRRLHADTTLDSQERGARLAELEANYPEDVQEQRERATEPLRHAAEERALRASGATDAEIDALRSERFGLDAAERMQLLDDRRAEWDERFAEYLQARDEIAEQVTEPRARELEIQKLRDRWFTRDEQVRAQVLERFVDEQAFVPGEVAPPSAD